MKSRNLTKIMVVAGGSGGHVFPAIACCQELSDERKDSSTIFFVTTPAFDNVPGEFNPIFLKVSRSPLGLLKLAWSSCVTMARIDPDVVFGFGGYISVPFLMLAKMLGKKAILHEQNVSPGKANRFLSAWADRIAISFPQTRKYLSDRRKKIFLTRYPLRRSFVPVPKEEALRFFGLTESVFTVLVTGGSQGAHSLNEKFTQAIRANKNLDRLQIIHLTGRVDLSAVKKAYEALGVKAKVLDFLPQMNYAYSASDLVVSRSGAGSVMEIMRFGLPSILVPYPFAGAHQVQNARVLAERGAAILLEDAKMSSDLMNGLLDIFIDDEIRRKTMASIATSITASFPCVKMSDLVFL